MIRCVSLTWYHSHLEVAECVPERILVQAELNEFVGDAAAIDAAHRCLAHASENTPALKVEVRFGRHVCRGELSVGEIHIDAVDLQLYNGNEGLRDRLHACNHKSLFVNAAKAGTATVNPIP